MSEQQQQTPASSPDPRTQDAVRAGSGARQPVEVVREAYAAFGRGDIPAVLDLLDPQVDWEPIVGAGPNVPMRGRRNGQAQVAQFFKLLGDNVTFETFEPREFITQGDRVATVGSYVGRATGTGRTFTSDWVMLFTVRNGKIAHFREYADVVGITAAF